MIYYVINVQLDEESKIVKVEFFFDRGELLAGLMKNKGDTDTSGNSSTEGASCPFLKSV